jgi:hypothetical protein
VRALEDRGRLLEQMADAFEPRGQARSARSFRAKALAAEQQARIVREALTRAASTSLATEDDDLPSEGGALRQAAGGGSL